MVRLQTISTNYKALDDIKFVTTGTNILDGVEGNSYYPNPPQKLDDLRRLLADLLAAATAMKTGLKAATQQRNFVRRQAEAAFKALSAYAVSATPARPDLWAAANFPLTKAETSPRPDARPITGLTLADGPSAHTLQATVDRQKGMYGYQWRIYPADTTPEQLAAGFCYRGCTTRAPRLVIEGLQSGVAYCVECAAWNEMGPLQWSAPVSRIVQ